MLSHAERLIVALDFRPREGHFDRTDREDVVKQTKRFAAKIRDTGVYVKVNSVLRAGGYDLIDEIHAFGLKVFADLKLFDIGETLSTDGVLLKEAKPEILTTVCVAGVTAMQALKAELSNTEILGVTVLTNFNDDDAVEMFGRTVIRSVRKFATLAEEVKLDGLICAATDISSIQEVIRRPMTFNTPAIRPTWAIIPGDDQNPDQIMTPAKAIKAGADRIVVGRPITKAENPYDAVMRTIEEIDSALAS